MKVIREHNGLIKNFPEHFCSESLDEVKLSYFTSVQVVSDEKIIIFNFVSDAILCLSQKEYEMILHMDFSRDEQLYLLLLKNGFFVRKDVDENLVLERQRHAIKQTHSETLKVVILPTTNCNASCHYCIGQKNQRIDMTTETASATIDFIVNKACAYKNVAFDWYGGEPLLKHELLTMMCKELQQRLPNVKYTSVITSNLVLFDDEMLDAAINTWHIRKINITFDGAEYEHNSRKNYIDCSFNGYRHTIQCIDKLLARGVSVFCRFNIDKYNAKELNTIVNELKPFYENKLFYFFVSPLRGEDNALEYFSTSEYNEMTYITNSLLIGEGVINPIDSFVPRCLTRFCLAKSDDCLVIGADGAIYRCNLCVLNPSNATGSIAEGIVKNDVYNYYMNIDLAQECTDCKFLPICQGGCPEQRISESKSNSPCNKFRFKIEAISKLLAEHYVE